MGSYQPAGVDLDGNITNAPLTNDTFSIYTFDARNRLSNAGGVTNTYDAINNRIGQTYGTNSTSYVVNPNSELPQVLMRVKNGVTNYYIYGVGLLYQITETATTTNTLTYHYDFRGSTIALSTESGLVTDRIEYSAYGLTTYRTGTNDTPFLFNGRYGVQTDPNGLLYMQARYYNPYLCRFLSADPSGFAGGLNQYIYANGNPVSYLDPFGLNAQTTGDNSQSWIGIYNNFATAVVPGQAAWNNAMSSWQAGNYGMAALDTATMVGQDVLFALTLGGSSVATPALNTVESGTTSVFWSGYGSRITAENWAAGSGGQTLSMSSFAIGEDATLAEAQSASTAFARSAVGDIQVFQPAAGVPINSIWSQFEYPTLMQNPNVNSITFQIFNESGNIIKTIFVPR